MFDENSCHERIQEIEVCTMPTLHCRFPFGNSGRSLINSIGYCNITQNYGVFGADIKL